MQKRVFANEVQGYKQRSRKYFDYAGTLTEVDKECPRNFIKLVFF